jgi:hypothetical protein
MGHVAPRFYTHLQTHSALMRPRPELGKTAQTPSSFTRVLAP